MFTLKQIEEAHSKVKSGTDFPKYIQEIKTLGVNEFETWVKDSHTEYYGENGYKTSSASMYENLEIENGIVVNYFKDSIALPFYTSTRRNRLSYFLQALCRNRD